MRLFIAEKPSLGRAIAAGLGNQKKAEGCILCGNDVVTWCFGHMLEQAWPRDYKPEYSHWRREHLPIIPSQWKYKVKKDAAAQLDIIGSLLREADWPVNRQWMRPGKRRNGLGRRRRMLIVRARNWIEPSRTFSGPWRHITAAEVPEQAQRKPNLKTQSGAAIAAPTFFDKHRAA